MPSGFSRKRQFHSAVPLLLKHLRCFGTSTTKPPNFRSKLDRQRQIAVKTSGGLRELWDGSYLDPEYSADYKRKNSESGYAWPLQLLWRKSAEDLHKLWYVLLKEKNLLLSERNAFSQCAIPQLRPGRLAKIRVGMKRIRRVLQQREIHEQCVRGKRILNAQLKREPMEIEAANLESDIKELEARIHKAPQALVARQLRDLLLHAQNRRQELEPELVRLRSTALEYVNPDWRYQGEYSDLPGRISWRKVFIRALADKFGSKLGCRSG